LPGYDVLRVAPGLLLACAALIKTEQLASGPVLGTGLLDSRLVLSVAFEFENGMVVDVGAGNDHSRLVRESWD
jgi:hypothetical protein